MIFISNLSADNCVQVWHNVSVPMCLKMARTVHVWS